jgi:hypothetical protein
MDFLALLITSTNIPECFSVCVYRLNGSTGLFDPSLVSPIQSFIYGLNFLKKLLRMLKVEIRVAY